MIKTYQKKDFVVQNPHFIHVVPEAGLEPAWYRYRWILSPVRLPISPLGLMSVLYYNGFLIKKETICALIENNS